MHDARSDTDRIAANEDFFRTLNQAITGAAEMLHDDVSTSTLYELMCECAVMNCSEMVRASLAEYHQVRSHDRRFLVRPRHVLEDVEAIVEEADRYWVIEKFGPAGERAEELADR